jgi:hypothetical protein
MLNLKMYYGTPLMQYIYLNSCYFHLSITSGLCEQIQWKCNTHIFSFEHCNEQMGRTNDHVGRYGWVVFGKYLSLGLVGRKVK